MCKYYKEFPVHKLQELMLFECQYSSKWSTDSVPCLSKFKWLLWQRPKLSIPSCGTKRGPKWLNDTEKENKSGRLILPNLKTYCKATVIKIEWNSHKDKHKDPWYRIEVYKWIQTSTSNWFLTKVPWPFNKETTVSSTNGAGTPG